MYAEIGTRVRTSDGQDIGTIEALVLDPDTGRGKAVAVGRGHLLHHPVKIELEDLAGIADGALIARLASDALRTLKRYRPEEYAPDPHRTFDVARYIAAGAVWPLEADAPHRSSMVQTAARAELEEMLHERDTANAVLEAGAEVMSRDFAKIGEVHTIRFDPSDGRLLGLTVRRGLLNFDRFEIPGDAIEAADDGVVYLAVNHDAVERMRHGDRQPV